MSAIKSGSALRALVLTPERIPSFFIPSRSPLRYLSPRLLKGSPSRARLLSDHDDDDSSTEGATEALLSPAASRHFPLHLRSPRVTHHYRTTNAAESADGDFMTRAATSSPHVEKVTTTYGFCALLSASPCTRRRESFFHKPVNVAQDATEPSAPPGPSRFLAVPPPPGPSRSLAVPPPPGPSRSLAVPPPPGPSRSLAVPPPPGPSMSLVVPPPPGPSMSLVVPPPPGPSRSLVSLRPVKALGLQVMKELKKPVAALKARRKPHPY